VGRGRKTRQETKRSKVRKKPADEEKKCGGRGSVTTTMDSMMSSRLSLCAGVETLARAETSSEVVRRREGQILK